MPNTSNTVKASQLGMPFGTAMAKLRKSLLFRMAQRLNEDLCYKCGLKIEKIEDFSIEHKKPWLHISPTLFWDLDNIAFSHVACNKPDRPHSPKGIPFIKRPEGMNWCSRHRKMLPISQFNKNKSEFNGLHHLCKECQHYTREK